jgi:hypothetical protein
MGKWLAFMPYFTTSSSALAAVEDRTRTSPMVITVIVHDGDRDLAVRALPRNHASVSYYAERSARDPEWRREQIAGAKGREQAEREADPEGFKARRRAATRRTRQRQAQHGLTFDELLQRSRARRSAMTRSLGDPDVLRFVLRDLMRSGVVDYHSTSRRYVLNGKLDAETLAAFRDLEL